VCNNNMIKEYTCNKWEDFHRIIKQIGKETLLGEFIFRGHSKSSYKLSSKWERILESMRKDNTDRKLCDMFSDGAQHAVLEKYLSTFKNLAIGIPNLNTDAFSNDDWWVLGRHHGLITPLLDWTRSPYIASYFAFIDHIERCNRGFLTGDHLGDMSLEHDPIIIWGLKLDEYITNKYTNKLEIPNEFEVIRTRKDGFYRQRAQQGLFTKLYHEEFFDLESYLTSRQRQEYLIKIIIPGHQAYKVISSLESMNIHSASLFPDLDGAASRANIDISLSTMKVFVADQ